MAERQNCRSCQSRNGQELLVDVTHRGMRRRWRVQVCRDCWRAWEAILEAAALDVQIGLAAARTVHSNGIATWLW
jgi:hypothetical protein